MSLAVITAVSHNPQVRSWRPCLIGDLRTAALEAVRDVAARLQDVGTVEEANAAARAQTAFPRTTHWLPYSISQGYAGLAVLWGYLDQCFPDEEWDIVGRSHLALAANGAERFAPLAPGLFSGLSGLGFAAVQLSRDNTRYSRMLAGVDEALVPAARSYTADVGRRSGFCVGDFDVISGLSGIAGYLLCRSHNPVAKDALDSVLAALCDLAAADVDPPRWHTPPHLFMDPSMDAAYPHGNLNCGLAHGIPGVLAALAAARGAGVELEPLDPAIRTLAEWLSANRLDDEWGVNWPNAIPLEPATVDGRETLRAASPSSCPDGPGRAGWCYGSPGIAAALALAGNAVSHRPYIDLAVEALKAVSRRPVAERRIDSPTFCHGIAGLLQVVLRLANETDDDDLNAFAVELARQVLEAYHPEYLLGFRNIEIPGTEVDQPGLLDGAPGVALALLAASTDVPPAWDRLFLLS
jgi:lantibiotic biosynthesis protein